MYSGMIGDLAAC